MEIRNSFSTWQTTVSNPDGLIISKEKVITVFLHDRINTKEVTTVHQITRCAPQKAHSATYVAILHMFVPQGDVEKLGTSYKAFQLLHPACFENTIRLILPYKSIIVPYIFCWI